MVTGLPAVCQRRLRRLVFAVVGLRGRRKNQIPPKDDQEKTVESKTLISKRCGNLGPPDDPTTLVFDPLTKEDTIPGVFADANTGCTTRKPARVPWSPVCQGFLNGFQRRLGRRIFVAVGVKNRRRQFPRLVESKARTYHRRSGSGRPKAGRRGEARTPTGRFAYDTTDPLAPQSIVNNCPKRPPGARTSEILFKPTDEHNERLTRGLSAGRRPLFALGC